MSGFTVSTGTNTQATNKEFTPSKEWINLGKTIQLDGEDIFVSLPVSIAFDGQVEKAQQEVETWTSNFTKKPNSYNRKRLLIAHARLALLEELKGFFDSMEAGAKEALSGLELQLLKRADEEEISEEEGNSIASDIEAIKAMIKL